MSCLPLHQPGGSGDGMFCSARGLQYAHHADAAAHPKSTSIGHRVQLDYAITEESPLGLDHKGPKRKTNVCCPAFLY